MLRIRKVATRISEDLLLRPRRKESVKELEKYSEFVWESKIFMEPF